MTKLNFNRNTESPYADFGLRGGSKPVVKKPGPLKVYFDPSRVKKPK